MPFHHASTIRICVPTYAGTYLHILPTEDEGDDHSLKHQDMISYPLI
jgi:hypothetical protein